MEGRTNLLPKVGGYVNGDIKNCVVATGNRIVLGDFVQFYATDFSTPVPGFKRDSSSYQFPLSTPGHILQILWSYDYGTNLKLTEKWFNGEVFDTEETTVNVPINTSYMNGAVCNLGEDKFLFLEKSTLSASIVEKTNGVWGCRLLTNVTYPSSDFYFSYGYSNLTRIHEGLFGSYRSDGKGVIVTYDKTTDTVVVSLNSSKVKFATNSDNNMTVSDIIYDETSHIYIAPTGDVYSVSGSVFTSISTGQKQFYKVVKIATNKWLTFRSTGSVSNQSFVITIDNGNVIYSDYIVFENIYSGAYVTDFNGVAICFTTKNDGIYANSIVYDENLDQFFEGEVNKIYSVNASQFTVVNYVKCNNSLGFIEYSSTSSGQTGWLLLYELRENNVFPPEPIVKVIKYLNKVNGIAKTSGNVGDTIQVFVPPTQQSS